MKKLKVVVVVIVAFIAALIGIFAYYGGFKSVECKIVHAGGETFVYDEMKGDYSQSPVIMDKIYHALVNEKIKSTVGCGIYYDNPQKDEKNQLRSEQGCIIAINDSAKIADLQTRFKVKIIPETDYLVAEFPFKGKTSIILGIMKVYPAINKYMNANGLSEKGAVIELYDTPNQKIIYRKEIVKE